MSTPGACPLEPVDGRDRVELTHKPLLGAPPRPDAVQDCGCPMINGVIRHDRELCTDPVVIRLDWFAT